MGALVDVDLSGAGRAASLGRWTLSRRLLVARRPAIAGELRATIIGEYMATYGRAARGRVAAKYGVGTNTIGNWIRRGEVALEPTDDPPAPRAIAGPLRFRCAYRGCDEYPAGVVLCARCGASFWCVLHLLWARKREQGRRHMLDVAAAYVLRAVINVCSSRAELAAEAARLGELESGGTNIGRPPYGAP